MEPQHPFSYYSLGVANVLKDTFHISLEDLDQLVVLRDSLRVDEDVLSSSITINHKLWFASGDFREEWNSSLVALDSAAISRFDSTLNLSKFSYQLIPLKDSVDAAKWKEQANGEPDSKWRNLQIAEIDTVRKVINQRIVQENKLRPLTRLQASVTDFIDRLKK